MYLNDQIPTIIVDFKSKRYLIPISILAENIAARAFSHCPTHYSGDKAEEHILKWIIRENDLEEPLIRLFTLYPQGTEYILKSCLYEDKVVRRG